MSQISFVEALREMVADAPEQTMVSCGAQSINRFDFDQSTNRLARLFQELGVRAGDLVALALPNGIAFYQAAMAAWKLGATPLPVSAQLPEPELRAVLETAAPRLIVGGRADLSGDVAHLPEGFAIPATLSDAPLPTIVSERWKASTSGGSTGRPKVIVAKTPAMLDPEAPFMAMEAGHRQLVAAPLYHSGPLGVSTFGLFRGQELVVMPRFDALTALQLIESKRIGWLMLVPTMMSRIWRLGPEVRGQYDVSSVQALWHMAAPCPEWLKTGWMDWLGPEKIYELYGGTESQGVTVIRGDEWLAHRGSVGKPSELFDFRILDDDGKPVQTGEIGEIFMRPRAGRGSTYYYLGAEARATDDGFETLGDMGRLDADGYLYIADRRTDMILCGGANIYPAEVEAAIEAHPAVRSSAVIGLPDEDLGNRVHAIVEAADELNAEELLAFVGERLARYKVPRSVEFVREPLRNEAGKVRRSELRRRRLEAVTTGLAAGA